MSERRGQASSARGRAEAQTTKSAFSPLTTTSVLVYSSLSALENGRASCRIRSSCPSPCYQGLQVSPGAEGLLPRCSMGCQHGHQGSPCHREWCEWFLRRTENQEYQADLLLQAISYAESWIRKVPSAPDRLSQQFVQAPSDPQPEMDLFKTVMTQMSQGTLVQGELGRPTVSTERQSFPLLGADALVMVSGALQGLESSRQGGLDDRKMLLEQVVVMLSTLPPVSSPLVEASCRSLARTN